MTDMQFIQFSEYLAQSECLCDAPMPVANELPIDAIVHHYGGIYYGASDAQHQRIALHITNANGDIIATLTPYNEDEPEQNYDYVATLVEGEVGDGYGRRIHIKLNTSRLPSIVAMGECFRLRLECMWLIGGNDPYGRPRPLVNMFREFISSMLVMADAHPHLSHLRYGCSGIEFGIPFTTDTHCAVYLPFRIYDPQLTQSDKTYRKRDGNTVVLFAEMTKEYSAETEYMPYEWHERLVTALSCDDVWVNEEKLVKSDSYEIDWDNCTTDAYGHRIAKATFKMKSTVTTRNSNY